MRIVAVIPARGGSKGVPRKNARAVGGKPLISYSIEAALAVRQRFQRIIVSTDDPGIANIARQHGAEVPFMRPAELATDEAPMVGVLRHAVEFVEQQDGRIDWVCLLQPSAPLRTPIDIEACLQLAEAGGCDSVISVRRVQAEHPMLMKRIEDDRLVPYSLEETEGTRRQDFHPPAYLRNGAIYVTSRAALMDRGSIWGAAIRPYIMPDERSVSVDTEMDLRLVELLLLESQGARATPQTAHGEL